MTRVRNPVDDVGEAFRAGQVLDDSQAAALDQFLAERNHALERALATIEPLAPGCAVSGRIKGEPTTREKLARTTLTLSQIRDIAGARVVLAYALGAGRACGADRSGIPGL